MKMFKRIIICLAIFAVLGFMSCNEDSNGTLRVFNRGITAGNFISKIEVLNTDDTIFIIKTYDSTFTTNVHADIDLPEGTYGLRVTRNPGTEEAETVWTKQSTFDITTGEITTVDFRNTDPDWD